MSLVDQVVAKLEDPERMREAIIQASSDAGESEEDYLLGLLTDTLQEVIDEGPDGCGDHAIKLDQVCADMIEWANASGVTGIDPERLREDVLGVIAIFRLNYKLEGVGCDNGILYTILLKALARGVTTIAIARNAAEHERRN